MQCKANAQQSCNEYRLPAHWRTALIVDEPTGLGRTGKSSPIFLLLATFTDLPAPANKYLKAIINKCERVGKRLNSWREPSVSGPGADFWGLIVGGGG